MAKIIGNTTATGVAVPDWNQTDPNKVDYIKNKPEIPSSPKMAAVVMAAANWTGSGILWSQAVTINGITANSVIDLVPSADQVNSLVSIGAMMTVENNNGAATVHVIGNKPNVDYTMKVLITEVKE